MKLISIMTAMLPFFAVTAFAGNSRTPAQQTAPNCTHTKPFACFGGGSPQPCEMDDSTSGFFCKPLPGAENAATEDVAVSLRCIKSTEKPLCPGGGNAEPCPGHKHLWMCKELPHQ